jgi:hypothetical protein
VQQLFGVTHDAFEIGDKSFGGAHTQFFRIGFIVSLVDPYPRHRFVKPPSNESVYSAARRLAIANQNLEGVVGAGTGRFNHGFSGSMDRPWNRAIFVAFTKR